jgi:hypothetical protein
LAKKNLQQSAQKIHQRQLQLQIKRLQLLSSDVSTVDEAPILGNVTGVVLLVLLHQHVDALRQAVVEDVGGGLGVRRAHLVKLEAQRDYLIGKNTFFANLPI